MIDSFRLNQILYLLEKSRIPMIFLTCILLFMSIESAEAMQRSREDITKRSAFSLLAPYPELQLVILEKVQVPKTHLRLVCKMSVITQPLCIGCRVNVKQVF